MPIKNDNETAALIYHNDMLMQKIIGDVEIFQDRNSLELTSQRLRALCLKTQITRRKGYAVRLEADPNWHAFLTLLMRPRKYSSRLSVCPCSEGPKEENVELVEFNYKERRHDPSVFYEGVRKRLLFQITEFEIKNRRFGIDVLRNIDQFPNLKRVIVINSRCYSDGLQEDEDEVDISERIKSLVLVLDRQWCSELETMKQLIGPNLKHLCCHINPVTTKQLWYIEELMVEMSIHEIQLDQCQVAFTDPQFPQHFIVAFTEFLVERSSVLELFVTDDTRNLSKYNKIVPTIEIQFRDEEDSILRMLFESIPELFAKVVKLRLTNLHELSFIQLSEVIHRCYSVKELNISNSIHNKDVCPIERVLELLPETVEKLYLSNCKLTAASIDLLINRGAQTIRTLHLTGDASGNTVQHFVSLLGGLQELSELKVDMIIPHLLYSKITEHAKLKNFIGFTDKSVPNTSIQILLQHFNHVKLRKLDRHKQQLTVSRSLL
ncbi:unnamed protein product [Caenorhabditis brenneri]